MFRAKILSQQLHIHVDLIIRLRQLHSQLMRQELAYMENSDDNSFS
jgi:hypothetical protein